MSLITDIETICNAINPTGTFILSSKFKANRSAFDIASSAMPLIILDNELSKSGELKKNNNIQEDTRIVLSVLTLDEVFKTDSEQNTLIEAMEAIARRIIVNIYQLLYVRPSGNQKYTLTPAFNVFASGLSGTIVDMKVNVNLVSNWCLPD